MEEAQAYEGVYSAPSFLDRAKESGPIGRAGLATVMLAVAIVLAVPYLTLNRRSLWALLGVAFCLGVCGYVAFDFRYIRLNLSLREVPTLRADCAALVQQKESVAEGDSSVVLSSSADFPPSFARLGIQGAWITNGTVQLSNGGLWGVLYDPQGRYLKTGMPRDVRPTWYRDLYEYREFLE